MRAILRRFYSVLGVIGFSVVHTLFVTTPAVDAAPGISPEVIAWAKANGSGVCHQWRQYMRTTSSYSAVDTVIGQVQVAFWGDLYRATQAATLSIATYCPDQLSGFHDAVIAWEKQKNSVNHGSACDGPTVPLYPGDKPGRILGGANSGVC